MKKSLLAMVALSAVAGVAQADVSLYGVLDMGIANLTAGQNANATMPVGVPTQIIPSNTAGKSVTTLAPNGLSQSVLGFKGAEDISGDLKAGFILEAGINPNSGTITDGLSGLTQGNANTSSGADSSRAGQLFNNRSTLYLSSKEWGTLSFGRQYTVSLDDIVKYDPQQASYAFSVVGFFGSYGGGGWTEDARLDNSVKYNATFHNVRVGALYQFGGIAGNNTANSAGQFGLGTDIGKLSMDAFISYKKDGMGTAAAGGTPSVPALKAIVSDTKAAGLFAKYTMGPATISGGVEHILYTNPTGGAAASGYVSPLGGYTYTTFVTNGYNINKVLNLGFAGVRYAVTPALDISGSFYTVHQLDYSGTGCSTTAAATCSGYLQAYALVADYHLSQRTDVYAGISPTSVNGGMSVGFAATENTTTMVGVRHRF